MVWSYSGDPAGSLKDEVRFRIGDTDHTDQMLSDEEIEYLISSYSGGLSAAWRALEMGASKYARLADVASEGERVMLSQRAEGLRKQAMVLKEQAYWEELVPVPYAGGISDAERESDISDRNLVQGRFYRGQFRPERLSEYDTERKRRSDYYG